MSGLCKEKDPDLKMSEIGRLESISKLLEHGFSRAPGEVRVAASRVSQAMRVDNLPEREDLALVLLFVLEQKILAQKREAARRKRAQLQKKQKIKPKTAKKKAYIKPKTHRVRRVSRSQKKPVKVPVETAFTKLLDEMDEDRASRSLRRRMGLSSKQVSSKNRKRVLVFGDVRYGQRKKNEP
jgi:hypothetical protein